MDSPGASDLTFSGFILSLATTAAFHFGDLEDPETGRRSEPDLESAARIIEVLTMLQEKTKGNLIPEEDRVLDDLLYELRMRYVKATQETRRIVEP
jgi:hypothetical protein